MRVRNSLVVAAVLTSAPVFAAAYQVVQTREFSGNPDFVATLPFDEFNPALGSLTSVYIMVSNTSSGGSLQLDNDAGSGTTATVDLGSNLSVSSPKPLVDEALQPIITATALQATTSATLTLTADDLDDEVGGIEAFSYVGDDYGIHTGGVVTRDASGFISSSGIDEYIGTGSFNISINAVQVANYGAFGGAQALIDPLSSSGSFTLVYNYSPIPEPAMFGVLALSFTGLAYRRRQA